MEFEQIGGPLCLDFVNTVHYYSCDLVRDDLTDFAAFVEWNRQWGALTTRQAETLIKQAKRKPGDADVALQRVKRLRAAIFQIFETVMEDSASPSSQMAVLNEILGEALSHLRLSSTADRGFELAWTGNDGSFESLLWPIARSAADILTSDQRTRVRQCNGERCTWLFLDMSKNKTRRWCNMADCGNRAKARRFYERTRNS